MISYEDATATSDILQAFAEPSRIMIIDLLKSGPKFVTELSKLMEDEIVNVSHHLGVLRDAGMVDDRKDGRFVIYTLAPKYFKFDEFNVMYLDLGWRKVEFPQR